MNKKLSTTAILLLALTLFSCQRNAKLHAVLELSGSNRPELEKVINHYSQHKKDSLKLRAAIFLIENMGNKYSIVPASNNAYLQFIKSGHITDHASWDVANSACGKALDSISQHSNNFAVSNLEDCKHISAEYLIQNIEGAFGVWENIKPHINYSFKQFCQYVLPYRVGNEALSNWRSSINKEFAYLIDSLQDPIHIFNHIRHVCGIRFNAGMYKYPYPLTPTDIRTFRWGNCAHMANYATLAMRSIGIPATNDMVKAWANRSSAHVWNVIMNAEGKFIPVGETNLEFMVSKIYRQEFINNGDYFSSNTDVNTEYDMDVSNISISGKRGYPNAYLCTFNNKNWVPIAKASQQRGNYVFKNVGRGEVRNKNHVPFIEAGKGIVYLPALENEDKQLYSQQSPLLLLHNGTVKQLQADTSQLRTITISRKYPMNWWLQHLNSLVVGSRFVASHNVAFANSKLIHQVSEVIKHPTTTVELPNAVSANYVRYVVPETVSGDFSISEISFYNNSERIGAEVVGSHPTPNQAELHNLVDNNTATYSYLTPIRYVDFKLKDNKPITHIEYSRFIGGNDVCLNNTYELYYWNKKWVSLGATTATQHQLTYTNVPSNALLLLKNHTTGIEERIFTYENDKQVWW